MADVLVSAADTVAVRLTDGAQAPTVVIQAADTVAIGADETAVVAQVLQWEGSNPLDYHTRQPDPMSYRLREWPFGNVW